MTIAMPLPDVDPFSPPLVCVGVNREWMQYVVGALSEWKASQAFEGNTESEDFLQRQKIYALEILLSQASEAQCPTMPTLKHDIVRAVHRENTNVAGGATVATTWTKIPLTHVWEDTTGDSVISDGGLYVPENFIYKVTARHVIYAPSSCQAMIRIKSNSLSQSPVYRIQGSNSVMLETNSIAYVNTGDTIEMEYWVGVAQATFGLGFASNISGAPEIYGELIAERIYLEP